MFFSRRDSSSWQIPRSASSVGRRGTCAPITLAFLALLLLTSACSGSATPAGSQTAPTAAPGGTLDERSASASRPALLSVTNVRFDRYSLEQGLSQSTAYCTVQDRRGFLWVGTEDGLNRFDGYGFRAYRHDPEDPGSLSNSHVRALFADDEDQLWIGTYGGGLDRLDLGSGRFTHYRHDPQHDNSLSGDQVYTVYRDQEGMVWVGTRGAGLNRLDPQTGRVTRYVNDPDDAHSLAGNTVMAIAEDTSGTLWIGTAGGLNHFDRHTEQFVLYRYDPENANSPGGYVITEIVPGRSGILWVGTGDGGLDRFDPQTETFDHHRPDPDDPYSLSDYAIRAVLEDTWGTLWVGTDNGLDRYDPGRERWYHYRNDPATPGSLSFDAVYSLFEDRSGGLWVGTFGGGLNRYDRQREQFELYRPDPHDADSLNVSHVWAMAEDLSGALWVGTNGGGLNRLDQQTGEWRHYLPDPADPYSLNNDNVLSLYMDPAGILWVGTWGGGLNRLDPQTGHFTHYLTDPGDPQTLSSNVVWNILADRHGMLWMGTSWGLNRLDPQTGTFTRYVNDPQDPYSLSDNNVGSLCEDRAGTLWVGTHSGINRLDPESGRFTHYRHNPDDPRSLSHDIVFAIHEDRSGTLWFGTWGGGLNKFDRESETFVHYRTKDGLPNDVIYGILEDDRGGLWLSTNGGLSRFDPQTETFRNYDVGDGLQSNEFNYGAYYQSRSGKMFFGGIKGFNAFYPDRVQGNAFVPPVVLTSLTQKGEPVDLGQPVEATSEVIFKWPDNDFEFEFTALSYFQPKQNQYTYMLQGYDDDWHAIGTRRFGAYTSLPGGTYTLRLKGANNDGLWNEEGISIAVTIVPPFWAAWWFRGVLALVLVGGTIGGYQLRIRSIENRRRELESLVVERTRTLEQRTQELQERTYESEHRQQELEALYRADEELYRYLRLDQVLQALVDIAVDGLGVDKSVLLVWDAQEERYVVRVARGFSPQTLDEMSLAADEGIVGLVAASGQPAVVEDTMLDERVAARITEPEGIRSLMHVPIHIDGEVFGIFNVSYLQPRAFDEDEQRLFVALAQHAILAIERAQLYEQAQELAVVEERGRLARELHDAVTQTLFSASLIAEMLPSVWQGDPGEGLQLLQELRQLTRGALAEMRALLLELRPSALAGTNLADLLRQLAEAVTGREGTPVAVSIEGSGKMPPDVHLALYRIAQEALNNVVKHAQANQVRVSLHCRAPDDGGDSSARVELCICDDGRGFDPHKPPSDRLGLGIMRERAQAIGAALTIESQPGQGTRVTVAWEKT